MIRTSVLILIAFLAANTCNAAQIFCSDLTNESDGALSDVSGWEAQGNWTVSSGAAMNSGNWQRARVTTPFGASVGDMIKISGSVSFMGSGDGGGDFFSMGFANTPEHTGATVPQVSAGFNWNGTDMTVGNVLTTGYDSGDALDVMFKFTMDAANDTWLLDTMVTNSTDGTSFSGTSTIGDTVGGQSGTTAWGGLNGGGNAYFGMRMLDNNTSVSTKVSTGKLETIPVPEPSLVGFGLLAAIGIISSTRRRSN